MGLSFQNRDPFDYVAFTMDQSKSEQHHVKTCFLHMQKQTQIRCSVTTHAADQCLYFCYIDSTIPLLNPKFQAFSHLLWLFSSVCVGPGRNP